MAFYKYKVRDQGGREQKGLIEAESESAAAGILRKKGLFVLFLKKTSKGKSIFGGFFSRIGDSKITDFTRQLSTMIDAGLPLTKSLQILVNQAENEQMKSMLEELLSDIEGGSSFADAVEKKDKYFSKTYAALIRSGEASGKIDEVLERLADNLEKAREFKNKVKGAMIYPVIVIAGMGAVMFIMMAFVVPKLTDLYTEFEVDLPAATKVLIVVADIFEKFWYLIILGVVGLFVLFSRWKKTKKGKAIWDKILLSIPLFGNLQKEITLIESSRTLGILVGAGVPITEALNIVVGATDNTVFKEGLEDARRAVVKGFPLGQTIARNENFPPIFSEMITIGEETGKLDETLQRLSAFFETKSEETVKGLTTAIEPLIMVVLGLGVGFLVLAIVMPIYNLTSAIK